MDVSSLTFREALQDDLSSIVRIYSEDIFGSREVYSDELLPSYINAFHRISENKDAHLMVVEYEGMVVASFQLNYLTYLSYQGSTRLLVENVYVGRDHRNMGIGKAMFGYIIDRAKNERIHLIQLTTNKQRPDAARFYRSLGFTDSHEGMKLFLQA